MKMKWMLVLVVGMVASQSAWCVPVSEYYNPSSDDVQTVDRSTASVSEDHAWQAEGNAQVQAANSPSNGTTFRAGCFH